MRTRSDISPQLIQNLPNVKTKEGLIRLAEIYYNLKNIKVEQRYQVMYDQIKKRHNVDIVLRETTTGDFFLAIWKLMKLIQNNVLAEQDTKTRINAYLLKQVIE